MRIRKDLAQAWLGWRQGQKQKDCPGCARSFGIVSIRVDGGRVVYQCKHCKIVFTLEFEEVFITRQLQASRFVLGDCRENP